MLKIVHSADLHLGSPFSAFDAGKGERLSKSLANAFAAMIDFCIKERVDILLLSGDIFDLPLPAAEDLALFKREINRLENTRVFAALGNHDYMAGIIASERVHVFDTAGEKIYIPDLDVNVYGQSFCAENSPPLTAALKGEEGKTNLLCIHANVDGVGYNPISSKALAESGFTYAALGHKHGFSQNTYGGVTACYSGCLMGRGFDETGEKGFVFVQTDSGKVRAEFISSQTPIFEEISVYGENYASEYEMLDFIADKLREKNLYRLRLYGCSLPDSYIKGRLDGKAFYIEILRESSQIPKGAFFDILKEELSGNPAALEAAVNAMLGRGDLI